MNYNPADLAVLFVCAAISSMGMGGGALTVPYLISFKALSQLHAQGISLFYFIPCSITSVFVYIKNGYIKIRSILPMLLGGTAGSAIGAVFIGHIKADYLRILFALFLAVSGISMLAGGAKNVDK